MEKKYNINYLNGLYKELKTWSKVADAMNVAERTVHRYRKEAAFVGSLLAAKEKTKTLHDAADLLNIDFNSYLKSVNKYGLIDIGVPLTVRDPRLERFKVTSKAEFLEYNRRLSARCPPSIGYNKVSFKFKNRKILAPFCDFHLGNEQTAYKEWAEICVYISEIPDIETIWVGDYTDNFTSRGFRAGLYEQILKVSEAKDDVKNAIVIMKDNILGILNGCHDRWMKRDEGFDISRYLADHAPKSYWMGNRGMFHLKIGDIKYDIFASHKTKRSSTVNMGHGMKTQFRDLIEADIYFAGHHHRPHIEAQWIRGRMVYVVQGSAWKRSDDWIEGEGIPDAPIRMPCVLLDNKKYEVTMFEDIKTAVDYL